MLLQKAFFIIAQILGLVALVIVCVSFQKNDKEKLIKYQIFSSMLYTLQYIFLSAWSGATMDLMCLIRNVIYSRFKDRRVPVLVVIIILGFMFEFSVYNYSGINSMLPFIGAVLYTIALAYNNLKLLRLAELISCLMFIIYNINVQAYAGLAATMVELINAIQAIIKFDLKYIKKNEKKFGSC